MRVIEIIPRDVSADGASISLTRILVEISNFPIGLPGGPEFPVTAASLSRFLESADFREQFINWYGAQIGASVEGKNASPLRKKFGNLKVGRTGKLPPKIYLRNEYEKLITELKVLGVQFPEPDLPLNREDRKAIVEFARKTSARWLRVVDEERVDLDQIVSASPRATAKLILAESYECSEEAVHSRLFS